MIDLFDADHLRLYNAFLSLFIMSLLATRLTTTWKRAGLETGVEAWMRRLRKALLVGVFAAASYASISAYMYAFPMAPHVPLMTIFYVLMALSLTPTRWVSALLTRKNPHA